MGEIRVGIGGWVFEDWRGAFYPKGLAKTKELAFAARHVTTIEINATYRSTFKPDVWRKWRDEVPDGFQFAVKASRYCTNRKVLASAAEGIERFIAQGLTELGPKLGPINWQFMETKKFDPDDMAAFLKLLPAKHAGVRLRHAIEPRHESFKSKAFLDLAEKHGVAIVYAEDEEFPKIDADTGGFRYARLMTTSDAHAGGITDAAAKAAAKRLTGWSKKGDVYAYFIAGAKAHNPAAAMKVLRLVG